MRRWGFGSACSLVVCLALHAACGGSDPPGGGSGNDGGGPGPGDGGGSGGDSGGGPGKDAGKDCRALAAELDQLRAAAVSCSDNGTPQCGELVDDTCCRRSLSVTDPNSAAVVQFEDALRDYKQSCTYFCPAIACVNEPSKTCQTNGNTCKQR